MKRKRGYDKMTKQIVPTKPIGCFLDYTYCASSNCTNKCGRKMSDEIKEELDKLKEHRTSWAFFCSDD